MEERKGTLGEEVTDLLMSGALEVPRLKIVNFPTLKEMVLLINLLISLTVAVIP